MKNHIKGFARMSFAKQKSGGFTLIELLVVIAIIGLLSSIVYASLGAPRKKARIANVQASFRAILPIISLCIDEGGSLILSAATPVNGNQLCSGGDIAQAANKWPVLPTGWSYNAVVNPTLETFSFSATSPAANDSSKVTCTVGGCILGNP